MLTITTEILHEIQKEVRIWVDKNFPDSPIHQPILGLMEELGELSHAVNKREQKVRLNEDYKADVFDAVGDIVIYLMHFCNIEGIDLMSCIEKVWGKVKKRDWQKHREEHERPKP